MTGFEPVEGTKEIDDGLADCTPKIYSTCESNEIRDSNGDCRAEDDCSLECDGGAGEFQRGFGVCQCNAIVKLEQICTKECQAGLLVKTFSDNNKIIIIDPLTNNTITSDLVDVEG